MIRLIAVIILLLFIYLIVYYGTHEEHTSTVVIEIEEVSVVEESVEEPIKEYIPDTRDVEAIAKTLYGECRGVPTEEEKAAVVWCILNRLDAGYADTISEIVSAPHQFVGYDESNPVLEDLKYIAEDVLIRHYLEKSGVEDVGRVLPPDYLYFTGDGEHNYFRNDYNSTNYWDWSLDSSY